MIIVVVGGQYGSEGKGKLISYLSMKYDAAFVVRTGGPNAGHISHVGGIEYKMRQLPSGIANPGTRLLIGAGAVINMEVLTAEIQKYRVDTKRIGIDPNAGILEPRMIEEERGSDINSRLSSTCSGVGPAMAERVARRPGYRLAVDMPELRPYLSDTKHEIWEADERGEMVIIEGTQGYGLSLYHCQQFPYCTSRDTTAAAFLSEVGIAPSAVDAVLVAMRTFPIRVGGNSGPMYEELTWEQVQRRSGYPEKLGEFTTVTGKLRRVGEFDWDLAARCIKANDPDLLAIHGADYLRFEDKGKQKWSDLSGFTQEWIATLEERLGVRVGWLYTGQDNRDIIDTKLLDAVIE